MSAVQHHPSASEPGLHTEVQRAPVLPSAPQWVELFVFLLLLAVCYWSMIVDTGKILLSSDDFTHGLFAPVVTAFMLWGRRHLLFVSNAAHATGLVLLIFGVIVGSAGVIGASSTLGRLGALISIFGCIWLLGGRGSVRHALYPLAILLFTFPIPSVLYAEITMPLQRMATIFAEHILEFLGFTVLREGNIIQLSHIQLSVVEACSGIRSLITLLFFYVIYAYFFESKPSIRALLIALSFPCAVFMNVVRIVSTGVLSKFNPGWAHGYVHDMLGYGSLIVSVAMIYGMHRIIRRMNHREVH